MTRLPPRELQVVLLMGRGLTPKQVARQLGIALYTVKSHVAMIGTKLKDLYPEYRPRERIIVFYREFLMGGEVPPDLIDVLAAALRLVREARSEGHTRTLEGGSKAG